MRITDGTERIPRADKVGKCNFCTLSCGHRFIDSTAIPGVVHDLIDSLESGCGHIVDTPHVICDSCRDLTVTVLWQLSKGERVG